jgi:hypothetical protein
MDGAGQPNLRITIIAADGLYKRDVFRTYALTQPGVVMSLMHVLQDFRTLSL